MPLLLKLSPKQGHPLRSAPSSHTVIYTIKRHCMPLAPDRKKQYRSIGHSLKPVVTIAGNGLSEGVLEELNRALDDHELIKVKLMIADRELRKQVVSEMCHTSKAEIVQEIGKVALVYREAKRPNLKLSNVR